ncbi:S9 family peptidase [uncultured Algimonas sp.]|uniref:S9 family peptidase n=1 Tax=uncultured Algimonas sp. TaxID=1547920 RepID=UPI0026222134|nr:S9 family peptidase [uncultured Algimonas sp.]
MKRILATGASLMAIGLMTGCATAPALQAPAPAVQTMEMPRYSAESFFATTSYGLPSGAGHTFGPTSGDLLVTSDLSGVFNAYRLDPETGEKTALTSSTDNAVSALSWFPEDERLLYTSDQGGDELNHVYVRELDGAVRDLTPGDDVKAAFGGWADDGNSFYVMTNERDGKHFDVYRYQTDGYGRSLIYQNDGYQVDAVSGDGRFIALTKNRTSADSDVYVVDRFSGGPEPKLVTPHEGNIAHSAYGFSADNRTLYYSTNESGEFSRAVSYDLATGDREDAFSADWDVNYFGESPSGRYSISIINADASSELELTDTRTGRVVMLNDLPAGEVRNVRFNEDESRIAFILNGDRSPSNIHVADIATGEQMALTDALNPEIDADMLVDGQVVRFASYDGLDIPGILYRPKTASAADPAPALVWVHGGPGGQSRLGYNPTIQHLVNHGYAVYAINNRGSSGYGKTFFHMDDKRHGDVDLKDVVASRDWLAEMDWVDEDRIGVIGGSYGGYMVAAALAFEPEVFDAGINIFGVTNWVRTLESIPPWWESFREALYDEMGDPATDAVRHRAISPLFHAENIVKPLLVVQGANDPRVLQVESDELVEAVRANGVPVEYVLFPDEGHGFRKRENRITASNAYVAFLDEHLK